MRRVYKTQNRVGKRKNPQYHIEIDENTETVVSHLLEAFLRNSGSPFHKNTASTPQTAQMLYKACFPRLLFL